MPYFTYDGRRLAYTVYGDGPHTTVLLPGMLLSQRMHVPLARALADRGNRVVTFDPLGHGKSDRPHDMRCYSMAQFAEQAVVGGTSLGANVTLSIASQARERLRGMVLEMPVLDNALLGCAIAFTPLLVTLTFGEPLMRVLQALARTVRSESIPLLADVGLDALRQDPGPSAAVLQGLMFSEVAPPASQRSSFEAPALVIGHPRDPIHPFSDAGALARELPNARLLDANSIVELRLRPERLTSEIAGFLEACWKPRRTRRGGPQGRRSTSQEQTTARVRGAGTPKVSKSAFGRPRQ